MTFCLFNLSFVRLAPFIVRYRRIQWEYERYKKRWDGHQIDTAEYLSTADDHLQGKYPAHSRFLMGNSTKIEYSLLGFTKSSIVVVYQIISSMLVQHFSMKALFHIYPHINGSSMGQTYHLAGLHVHMIKRNVFNYTVYRIITAKFNTLKVKVVNSTNSVMFDGPGASWRVIHFHHFHLHFKLS